MNPENRLVKVHKGIAVELFIVLVRAILWIFRIKRQNRIQRLVLAVALIGNVDVIGHKRAVFFNEIFNIVFVEEFLFFGGNMHYNFSTAFFFVAVLYTVCRVTVRLPVHRGLVLI